MSTPTTNLTPDNRGLVEAYQRILDHDPAKWEFYPHLAAILSSGAEQSHIYLQGAWRALERREYKQAEELSAAAERVYGRTFKSRLIDIELLKRQGQGSAIPQKLLEIAETFNRKNLPVEEVKAYKRLSLLDPNPAYYQRIMILYTQINKVQKASEWASKLAKITPPKAPPSVSKLSPPAPLPPPPIHKDNAEAKQPNFIDQEILVPKSSNLSYIAFGKALWAKFFGYVEEEPPLPIHKESAEAKQSNPTDKQISVSNVKLPEIAFGKALWAKYFGDVGEEPPLPPDIDKILSDPCPIEEGKKVRETHMLVLVPQTVNGKPLTLKTLGKLVRKPLQGEATKYRSFDLGKYNDPPAPKTHWALMSRDVIPGSRGKSYQEQHDQVVSLREKTKLSYEVPTLLDAAVCIFMEYFRTGTYLYGRDPWTFTRCQEKYKGTWNLAVGGFAPGGLSVFNASYDFDFIGVAVLRKFF